MKLYSVLRPLLFMMPPEMAHHLTLTALKWLHCLSCLPTQKTPATAVKLAGVTFPNRVGLAAGLDKNGDYLTPLAKLGFGFVEIGTITPKPQVGNPRPRLFRLIRNRSLINRMGFNNHGLEHMLKRLKNNQFKGTLGINIGKNKATSNEASTEDYLLGLRAAYPYASYVTINISSPNTPGLRQLQCGHYLSELLNALKNSQAKLTQQHQKYVPLFLKIAPDMTKEALYDICHAISYYCIDGIIVTNTSISREGLAPEPHVDEGGGLSGQAITALANQTLTYVRNILPKPFPVIAVGGIMDADDALKKVELGADLVQLYTGLIYSGPSLIRQCIRALEVFFTETSATEGAKVDENLLRN